MISMNIFKKTINPDFKVPVYWEFGVHFLRVYPGTLSSHKLPDWGGEIAGKYSLVFDF